MKNNRDAMKKNLHAFVTPFLLFALLLANTASATTRILDPVVKSPNDPRDYLAFQLENEMTVLVISDPEADKASAAVDINVGSANDPEGYEGMAHFLEHMLFLGTEKYPEAGSYQRFISEHGGQHNAFTSFRHTNYFFDVDANYLEPALDRFSQQFVAPLFNEIYVDRERNAVHSEFTAKIKDDFRRVHAAFRETLNPKHPYSRFSVGNLTTLDNSNNQLRQALVDFYHANYSANLMTLVVYGKEPVDQLRRWVEEKFSAVRNRHLKPKPFGTGLFDGVQLPQLLSVEPNMNSRNLQINFRMGSQERLYLDKPAYYVANLVGHEGQGSLLSVLKEKGWANALSAGTGLDTGEESLFNISISLTPEGLEHWQSVLKLAMTAIEVIRKDGMKRYFYEEQKKILDLGFEYQNKIPAINYTSGLAGELHIKPVKDVIRGNYLLAHYVPDQYLQFLSALTPGNAQVTLVAKGVTTDRVSKWYEAPYSVAPLDVALFEPDPDFMPLLHVPEPNEFIPEHVGMVREKTMKHPVSLEKQDGFESWFATDTEFGVPQSVFYINIRSPKANDTPLDSAKTALLVELLKDELNEFSYPAYLAGLSYKVYAHIRGITIRIEGFPEKQSVLLNRILLTLTQLPVRRDRLEIHLEAMKRSLENASKKKPFEQTIMETRRLVSSPLWSEKEKLAELDRINLKTMQEFIPQLLENLEIVTLIHGNTTRSAALSLNQLVKSYLYNHAGHVDVPSGRVVQLKAGELVMEEMAIDHPDTGYTLLVQGRNTSWQEKAYFSLVTQISSPEYYRQMRTEKQLGYIVFAMPFSMFELPGVGFVVQSPKVSPNYLHKETSEYLESFLSFIAAMDDETFERNKQAIIRNLTKKDTQLTERSNRYWTEIDRQIETFDANEQLARAVEGITRDQFLEFVQEAISRPGRRLVTFNTGKAEAIQESLSKTPDADAFAGYKAVESKEALWKDHNVVQAR